MQSKHILYKIPLILSLTIVIGISSTACTKQVVQNIPEATTESIEASNTAQNKSASVDTTSDPDKTTESKLPDGEIKNISDEVKNKSEGNEKYKDNSSDPKLRVSESPSPKLNTVPEQTPEVQPSTALSETTTTVPVESPNPSSPPSRNVSTPNGDEIFAYASKFLGIKYIFGGTSPVDTNPDPAIDNSGFDDSGFVQYIFAHFDIAVGRNERDQVKVGTDITKEELRKGDIVFFGNNSSNPTHVGIYTGNNSFIHAPAPGDVVKISSFNRTDFISARRVID